MTFKNKGRFNAPLVCQLAKQMGFSIHKNNVNDAYFRAKEQGNLIKEKMLQYLFQIINEENDIEPLDPLQQYKIFVGKGNNSIMIRTLFKTRYWWHLHDKEEYDRVNLMWTQLRKNAIMD